MNALLFGALFSLALSSEPLPRCLPKDAGMDGARLARAAKLYRDATEEDRIKGAVLMVLRGGKVVMHEAMGLRDAERGLPFEKDTLFRMASNTKPVIACAVLMLAEEGKLDLNAEVSRYLPAFGAGEAAEITIHHLLTHTSGLRIPGLFVRPLLESTTLRKEVDRFAAIGPEVEPGTAYAYSNPGYNTLGAVIEVASGMPLEQFLTERIYRPLGMDDTSNHEIPEREARMATVYRRVDGVWKRGWGPGDPPDLPFVRASGGMISTAEDYARFLQMFLNGGTFGGRRLLRKETVALATRPHTDDVVEKGGLLYGYGWIVDAEGRYSHGGSDGTYAWVDPTRALIGIVFTQSPGGDAPRDEFVRLVTEACTGDPPQRDIPALNANFLDPDLKYEEWVERFEGESREVARAREAIVATLGLGEGARLADVGAGTGLFLAPFSRAVGETGKVYAVDISPNFVDHLEERARDEGLANVVAVLCTERSTELEPDSIDAAFVCDTYHHFSHPADTLQSLYRALRPGGRLWILDFDRHPGRVRKWVLGHVRAGKEVVRAEIEGAGFRFVQEHAVEGLKENYLLEFRRP